MARPQLQVRTGLNYWRLLRTDRDDQTEDKIPKNTAAAVRYFLGLGLSPEANQQLVQVKKNEWRFDAVRPLQLIDISRDAGPSMPLGEVLADRVTSVPDTVPSVSGKRPWWVLVRFWWRDPPKSIDYPGVKAGPLWHSWALNGADWVLDRAVYVPDNLPGKPPDPGGATWAEALGDKAESAFLSATDDLGDLLGNFGTGLAILAVLWLLSQSGK